MWRCSSTRICLLTPVCVIGIYPYLNANYWRMADQVKQLYVQNGEIWPVYSLVTRDRMQIIQYWYDICVIIWRLVLNARAVETGYAEIWHRAVSCQYECWTQWEASSLFGECCSDRLKESHHRDIEMLAVKSSGWIHDHLGSENTSDSSSMKKLKTDLRVKLINVNRCYAFKVPGVATCTTILTLIWMIVPGVATWRCFSKTSKW